MQRSFLKAYGATLLLLAGILAGGAAGLIFGPAASVVKPVGDVYLNLIFVLIVPLVFFSVTGAVCRMRRGGLVGRMLGISLGVFLGMGVIAATLTFFVLQGFNPLDGVDKELILKGLPQPEDNGYSTLADTLVATFTVNDFPLLLSKSHLLPLMIVSILAGLAAGASAKYGDRIAAALETGTQWIADMMGLLMKVAPIGLGCYFAHISGTIGTQLLSGYLRAFVIYLVLAAVLYFVIQTVYVWIACGPKGIGPFWKAILTPSLIAISTSSSAICMPASMAAARSLGVSPAISDTVIPLGTNIHKDGCVMLGVVKVCFLLSLFGLPFDTGSFFTVVGVALLVGAVMGAIPTGGMTGELLICSIFGFPPEMAAILMVISTICDIPATLCNATGNVVSALLVQRFTPRKTYQSAR